MKEEFLHYLWQYKKFNTANLKTTQGLSVQILNQGHYLQQAGPDFFNAQLSIDNQKWAGNVEIHVKSSDWYLHQHEKDSAYDTVILHVVWDHDTEVYNKSNVEIPVLELKQYVASETIQNYQALTTRKSWIFCENQLKTVDQFVVKNWQERLFFERLERKSLAITALLTTTLNDWEAVFFCLLAKNFGLNTNGDVFFKIAQAIPFSIIKKERFEVENLEALFFGFAGMLNQEKEDVYYKDLSFRFHYLLHKHQIVAPILEPVQFFKNRPDNFPTIRLAQLANLYHTHQNLFSSCSILRKPEQLYSIFTISVSKYWETHYQFDRESPKKKKGLSKSFIDLLLINTLIPIQFAYGQNQQNFNIEELLTMANQIPVEKNVVIDKFSSFGIHSKNAFESQSLLQLKNEYCSKSRCLSCEIGTALLKN